MFTNNKRRVFHIELMPSRYINNNLCSLSLLCGWKYNSHVSFDGFLDVFNPNIFINTLLKSSIPNAKIRNIFKLEYLKISKKDIYRKVKMDLPQYNTINK